MRPAWVVLYDGDCELCTWLLAWLLRWDRESRLRPVTLQGAEADERLADLEPSERMASWHLITPAGRRFSGGAALAPLLRLLPGGRVPAFAFASLPAPTERGYRWVADHRSQLSEWVPSACKRRAARLVEREQRARIKPPWEHLGSPCQAGARDGDHERSL